MKTTDDISAGQEWPISAVLGDESPDRRRHPRYCPTILSAIVQDGEHRCAVTVADISRTGARIMNAPPELAVGETLHLATLLHGADAITVPCRVVHVNSNEAHAELGLRFEDMDAAGTEALDNYLQKHLAGETGTAAP